MNSTAIATKIKEGLNISHAVGAAAREKIQNIINKLEKSCSTMSANSTTSSNKINDLNREIANYKQQLDGYGEQSQLSRTQLENAKNVINEMKKTLSDKEKMMNAERATFNQNLNIAINEVKKVLTYINPDGVTSQDIFRTTSGGNRITTTRRGGFRLKRYKRKTKKHRRG